MEIIVIANNIVKPSSPTPQKFKTFKLSKLDQLVPSPTYIPLIFFYENDEFKHVNEYEQISLRLKQSLSETLTLFYPLAGTIKQNSFVDCDDRGAEFVEARVHTRLAQLIQNPKMEELVKQLVPTEGASTTFLSVKTSYFDCGGIAIGVLLSHKIGDVASFVSFINAWATTCRGESSRIILPCFDLALHFPQSSDFPPLPEDYSSREKIATKRLVFESEKIEKLRARSSTSNSVSRVQAVSAFIWRSFIEANKGNGKIAACHTLNLRPRVVPVLPEQTFGNCVSAVVTSPPSEDDDDDALNLECYASKLRASIRGVDGDYINKVIKGEQYGSLVDADRTACCTFSSWVRFPVYDVDFGWGKPVRVCTAPMPFENFVVLIDTPSGDGGIEAWVNTPHHHHHHLFQILQANYDIITSIGTTN